MRMHFGISVGLTLILALPLFGDVIHDESMNGELSNDFENPTVLVFALGSNEVIGQIGDNGQTGAIGLDGMPADSDADYFRFDVAPERLVTGIDVQSFTWVGDPPGASFVAYTIGSSFAGQGIVDIKSFAFFDDVKNPNILDNLVGAPLGPGTYSFWFQETENTIVDYEINFTVVPEPTNMGICVMMSAVLFWRQRRCSFHQPGI